MRELCLRLWLPLLVVGLTTSVLVTALMLRCGSYSAAMAYLQGQVLFTDSTTLSLGEIPAGEKTSLSVSLKNLTSRSITLIGVETTCGCLNSTDLPLLIEPCKQCQVVFSLTPPSQDIGKTLVHSAKIYSSVPGPPVELRIVAEVVKPPSREL